MDRLILVILAFPVLLLNAVRTNAQQKGLIADHHAIEKFDSIPDSARVAAIALRMMFRHASVGGTIDNALECLQGTKPRCTEYPLYKYDRRKWEFQPRGNSGWKGKVDDFVAQVDSHAVRYDVFSFKYCYLDALDGLMEPCGSTFDPLKMTAAWEYLRERMELLEMKYPERIFIWWTIPLTQVGQFCTDTLNTLMRAYARQEGKFLFDIADIEAHDDSGNHIMSSNGREIAYKPFCGEQKPDAKACHPNEIGAKRLAKALWWMMANIGASGNTTGIRDFIDRNQGMSVESYPNPSRALTMIRLTLREATPVTVSLYDLLGHEVRTIATDHLDAGTHHYYFPVTGITAGTYIYRIITPSFTQTKALKILH